MAGWALIRPPAEGAGEREPATAQGGLRFTLDKLILAEAAKGNF